MNTIDDESDEKYHGREGKFARAAAKEPKEDGKQNHRDRDSDKCRGNVAEVLAHADAESRADPASDGVDPSSLAAAFGGSGGDRKMRRVGNESDGVKRDADGVEDGCSDRAGRIEQKETCKCKRSDCRCENDG